VLADKLPESILTRVKKGMAAVWFKPTRVPTAYAVRLDAGTVVVAALPAAFDSAASQADLIRYAELALTPDALQLPSDNQTQ